MASTPIRRERFEILDELGFEEVARLFIERHPTVRAMVRSIFKPRAEGETPGAGDFYAWLKARGLEESWKEIVKVKGAMAADESVEVAMNATPKTAAADRLKNEALRWQARVSDPGTYGDKVGLAVSATIGGEWAAALAAVFESAAPALQAETDGEALLLTSGGGAE